MMRSDGIPGIVYPPDSAGDTTNATVVGLEVSVLDTRTHASAGAAMLGECIIRIVGDDGTGVVAGLPRELWPDYWIGKRVRIEVTLNGQA